MLDLPLDQLQQWMQAVIVHPADVELALTLGDGTKAVAVRSSATSMFIPVEEPRAPGSLVEIALDADPSRLRCAARVEPPGNVEYFLTEIFDSAKRNGGRPSLFDMAFLASHYRSEYRMLAVPDPVQRTLFPVVVTIGRLLGKYERYADAPEPVQ